MYFREMFTTTTMSVVSVTLATSSDTSKANGIYLRQDIIDNLKLSRQGIALDDGRFIPIEFQCELFGKCGQYSSVAIDEISGKSSIVFTSVYALPSSIEVPEGTVGMIFTQLGGKYPSEHTFFLRH